MSINYKEEVDSGIDRKRIVESAIISCLKEGIPLDIIEQSKAFNIRHREMLKNLEKNYNAKEEEISNIYFDGGLAVIADNFCKVSHPVGGELYPMTSKEEIAIFQKLQEINMAIENYKISYLEQETEKCENNLKEYVNNNPVINTILSFTCIVNLLEKKENKIITLEEKIEMLSSMELDKSKLFEYNLIYEKHKELSDELSLARTKLKEGKKELFILNFKKTEIEEEIIRRNTKLVNWFIRAKYGKIVAESDDLFQVCYLGLGKAVRGFDYTKGFKFSSYAYRCMDIEVKQNFKELTGLSWSDYWTRKNVIYLLEFFKEELGQDVTIEYLEEQGLLPVSIEKAKNLINLTYTLPFGCNILDDITSIDDVEEDCEQTIEDTVFEHLLSEDMDYVLSTLGEKRAKIVKLVFGLGGREPMTFSAVAKIFNCSSTAISHQFYKAIRMLKHRSRTKNLEMYYHK